MNYPKLPPEFKEKWVAALRSGKFEQATGKLEDDGKYCCLGVAALIAGCEVDGGGTLIASNFNEGFERIPKILTGGNSVSDQLMNMNDGIDDTKQHSFSEIADWIEKNL